MFHAPERYRWANAPLQRSGAADGNNGVFVLRSASQPRRRLYIIASDGMEWEHVSIHADEGKRTRIPTWVEMCQVKAIFWDAEDVVMQLHPRESEYVNDHPDVLHLWRPIGQDIPTPPSICVGIAP